jgi:uncharacterized protein (TIGR02466 family)
MITVFQTNILKINKNEMLNTLIDLTNPFIKKVKLKNKKLIKKLNKKLPFDFGMSHHSENLPFQQFKFLYDEIAKLCSQFAFESGYNIDNHNLIFKELWVQEFGTIGGHHVPHIHPNSNISGFYFLKCSDNTSAPTFYDPRIAYSMLPLPQKDESKLTSATHTIHFKPKPGDFIIFPSYLSHGFSLDVGIDPFRFIHFNASYQVIKNEE